MEQKEISKIFECLGEIWRDITAIEFLMRCAIAKKDNDTRNFPTPPYEKGKTYDKYPDSFSHYSFEIITDKFNKRFPKLRLPEEVIQLRDAMAHGITAEINKDGIIQLVKFKEDKDKKKLKVEFSLTLELERLSRIRISLREFRRCIMKEIDEK